MLCVDKNMESVETIRENGKFEKSDDSCQQYESKKEQFLDDYNHMDNKSFDFEMNCDENGAFTDEEEQLDDIDKDG